MKYCRIYFTCLLFFLLSFPYLFVVRAENKTLTVTPGVWEIRMKPGVQYRLSYTVSAPGTQQYTMRLVRFSVNPDGSLRLQNGPGFLKARLVDGEWGIPKTVGKEDTEFGVVLSTAADTQPQDVYVAIAIDSLETPTAPGAVAIQVSRTLLLPLYISIVGSDHTAKGAIEYVKVGGLFRIPWGNRTYTVVDSFQPIPVEVAASNAGRHFFNMQSRLLVTGAQTKQSVLLEKTRILAGSVGQLQGRSGVCRLWYCPDNPSVVLNGAYVGPYEVRAEASIGVQGHSSAKVAHFLALPLMHGGIVVMLIVAAVLYKRKWGKKSR